jgi:Cu/Ag efflux protein CusF
MVRQRSGLLGLAALLLTLAACSGGGGDGSGTASTTAAPASASSDSVAVGTVTGFGSVIIDGVRFDDSAATIEIEREPGAIPVPVTPRQLRIGQRALVEFFGDETNARARAIRVDSEIVGVVDSVDAAGGKLVVAGQEVRINTNTAAGPVTTFEGYASLADVKAGDRVEIHGLPKADAGKLYIQATRIERASEPASFVRVTGTIKNLAATTFELGALKVSYSGTTRLIPSTAKLANDMRVVVWSDTPAVAGTLTAKSIRVKGALPAAGSAWISGAISDCTGACAASFKVNGLAVDATKARFPNGSAATLANGVFVRVRGDLDAATGKIVATQVVFRGQDDLELEVRGTISGYTAGANGTATFTVRAIPVQINAQTKLDGCPATLADGLAVKVEGKVAANVFAASEVKCLPSLDAIAVEIRGTIGAVDAAAKTFRLVTLPNLPIAYDATTKLVDGTAAQIVVGAFVEVEGTVKSGTLAATEIEFKPAPSAGERPIKGMVFEFNAQTGTFKIGALTFAVGSAALPAGFADGARVEVHFTSANGVNTATRIKLLR